MKGVRIKNPDSSSEHLFMGEHGNWIAYWWVGDRQRRKSMRTHDLNEARKRRDELFAMLKRKGAKPSARKLSENAYIYRRHPFEIRVRGRHVGYADTVESARRIRDQYLKGGGA